MIRDWRNKWHDGTAGATNASFPFGWVQLNACNRASWAESRTVPAHPVPTDWQYVPSLAPLLLCNRGKGNNFVCSIAATPGVTGRARPRP